MKPGYKQTEVGVIPEEWEVKRLGEVATIATGNTPPTSDSSNYGDEFHFVGPVDMGDAKSIAKTEKMLSKKGFAMSRRFPKDSILFVSIGSTIGKCGIAPVELTSNQQINAIFPSASFSADYLFYAVSAAAPRIKAQASEQAVPIVNKTQFSETAAAFPPLTEQRAIATALSDVDGLLGGLDRLIAKKRDLKQAAMQQLLTGQTRIPGFHAEWEVKRLGEVGEISSAGVDKKIRPDEVPVRLVNYLDVYHKDFIYSKDLNHWVTAPPQQAKRCAVQTGDVFFTPTSETRDDIGNSAVAMEDIPDAAYSYHVARLRLHEPWDLCFRTYVFKTRAFLDQAETLCDGNGTRYVISQGKFRSMTVQVPPLPEQTAIASVLSEMDGELAVLEQRREKTRALKQAMMQELLTGRTRLL
jgi:type I restriction enzyme S subunit